MVYEANPAAISSSRQDGLPLSMLLTTPSSVRYVYSLYPEAAKLKILATATILHYAVRAAVENIRLTATVQRIYQ
jgi:hypothetical protein